MNCPDEELIEGAIHGGTKRKGKLFLAPRAPSSNTLVEYGVKKDTVDVALVPWKSLLKRHPWGAIKADIQGAEYSMDWSFLPPSVQVLAIEYHYYLPEMVEQSKQIHDTLLSLGFVTQRKPVVNLRMKFSEAVYKRVD